MTAALVPVAVVDDQPSASSNGRPRADFLAHLIATATQAPQTRQRRRAEPAEAMAAYEAASGPRLVTCRSVSRSL